ncbi:hypothetical protein QBC34DRAFT_479876 [Podospora aff. communis PSN243]|uniref:Apple domain-containing protein n=1 Tax=Podospora aff. communis PSN243 TaxID=3040156 RepID=A0AAV9G6A4_9PEZI|nr:hypothetical protein QBC34DRAFT_479876 [Podospora aff. communis PSN243]
MDADTHSTLDSQKELVTLQFEGGLEVADKQPQYHHTYTPPSATETKHSFSGLPSETASENFYTYHSSHLPPIPPMTPLPPAAPERRILGLQRTTFILSAALAAVIIAAIIGGSVGGVLSVKRAEARCQEQYALSPLESSTPLRKRDRGSYPGLYRNYGGAQATVTVTVVTAGAVPTTILPATATLAGRVAVPTVGILPLDCPRLSGTTVDVDAQARFAMQCGVDLARSGEDTLAFTAYTAGDCLRACASLNRNNGGRECKGVVFNADMGVVEAKGGTCRLRRDVGGQVRVGQEGLVDLVVVGVLVS